MNYTSVILNRLIDIYEHRGLFRTADSKKHQGIFLSVEKTFPEYNDLYDERAYQEINEAIEHLRQRGILQGNKDERGQYGKLRFQIETIDFCYQWTGRTILGDTRRAMLDQLNGWETGDSEILERFRTAQIEQLHKNKPVGHGIGDQPQKLADVLLALSALMKLTSETYVRNFSNAVFGDSKRFQKIQGCIESILCAYGGQGLTQHTVLSAFNLVDNPTYVMFKGLLHININGQEIHLEKIPGGISLPSTAVPAIRNISIEGTSLITVENLTTYHDEPVCQNAIVYLGGFHNTIRTDLLKRIYAANPDKGYFHKGDIDVYGFVILENLKRKTGIPFLPLEMDLDTLKEFEACHLIKPLNASDRKMLHIPQLSPYQEILTYMEQHDCKAEQESRQALRLLHKK
ncbi:hypothetical protein D1646_02890 [Pseudoflavonifractor sp. 60]|uniref:Wadjet anti-phage system protein JetD domain-containing protein n=1 Tax=Pseudoflavonifractor sp. 60 TaxID=2304576 RepID=UPI00136FD38C|nr:Wadjet anti-phage system protein JetD domain-containing protein [Pseudoflavonifractor sp. 60]NBI65771.1 hypothetical protein [Pseudoflavonifractor sp. 60]